MKDEARNLEKFAETLIELMGGQGNIIKLTNCMTRLRVTIRDMEQVEKVKIEGLDGVLGSVTVADGIQIILGPGKAKTVADLCLKLMQGASSESPSVQNQGNNWEQNKKQMKEAHQSGHFKEAIRNIAEIFLPLIPAIIAAGLFAGVGNLLLALQEGGTLPREGIWNSIQLLLNVLSSGFLAYFAVFTGVNAAKQFHATEVLGGMIGAISISAGIVDFSQSLGLYNQEVPLNSILTAGKGGVIGVIIGVWILARVEQWFRKRIPDTLSLIFVPFLTLLTAGSLFVIVIMPFAGLLSDGLLKFLNLFIGSSNPVISIISGYILAALFLPMVLFGLHHGLVPIYSVQLQSMGGISLFPVLTMAGAGQVGAAIALLILAKKVRNQTMVKTIRGALPAGILGVGEPLIYGVTLPLFKPFITAGLGAGFGGAYVMMTHVMSVAWEPSGVLGVIVMQPASMLNYLIGLILAVIGGFVITFLVMRERDVAEGILTTPLQGRVQSLESMQDGVFSEKILGDGIAIEPSVGEVYAPADGAIALVMDTKHAIAMKSKSGTDIMIHVGLDTVKLAGRPFEVYVKAGDPVKRGQLLMKFDMEMIRAAGCKMITPVIITNAAEYEIQELVNMEQAVKKGKDILKLTQKED